MTWIGTRQPDGTVSHEEMRQMGTYFSDTGREEQRVMDQRWENSYLAARLEAALERIEILEQQVTGLDAEQQRLTAPVAPTPTPGTLYIPDDLKFDASLLESAGWCAPSETVYLSQFPLVDYAGPDSHENEPEGVIQVPRGGLRFGGVPDGTLLSYGDHGLVTINTDGSVDTVSEPAPDVSAGQEPVEHHITWRESGANPPADLHAHCSCSAAASGPGDYVPDWIDKHIREFGPDVTVRRQA